MAAARRRGAATAARLASTAAPTIIQADAVVVGAGVVGLAAARALARRGREVLLLDARSSFGAGTSSRNSEVVHAGLYYHPSSLKARFCVTGAPALLAYAAARNIPHATPGKLIVAVQERELGALAALAANARASGVTTLARLDPSAARALEPGLGPVAGGLHSPTTAIIDSHALMAALLADAEAGGGTVWAPRTSVVGGVAGPSGGATLDVVLPDGEAAKVTAKAIILAAGLGTPRLAGRLGGLAAGAFPPGAGQWVAKGSYFRLDPATSLRPPFTRLIYPLPPTGGGGLGVHLTLDLGGGARFGPDVEWCAVEGLEEEDGSSDPVLGPPGTADPAPSPGRAAAFAAAIRAWWPGLPPDARLVPDYAGVRPKLVGPGEAAGDFVVAGAAATGVKGTVGLFGIESPGLTACLMLGEAAAAEACGEAWRGKELDVGI